METIEEYKKRLDAWIDATTRNEEHKRKKLHTPVLVLDTLHTPVLVLDTLHTIPIDNIPIVQPSGL
jgi:hypothetical protein